MVAIPNPDQGYAGIEQLSLIVSRWLGRHVPASIDRAIRCCSGSVGTEEPLHILEWLFEMPGWEEVWHFSAAQEKLPFTVFIRSGKVS